MRTPVVSMNEQEIFQRWLQAHARADTASMAEYMDEDFVFEQDGFPQRLDKEEYLNLVEAMGNSFPDLQLDADETDLDAEQGLIRWRKQLSATHEQDLDLTALGLPLFFPTGDDVEMDGDEARTRIVDGKISSHEVDGEDAGLAAMIDQVEAGLESLREEAQSHPDVPD